MGVWKLGHNFDGGLEDLGSISIEKRKKKKDLIQSLIGSDGRTGLDSSAAA